MKQWYVVHSQVNAERRALENLERQGYSAWLPLYRKTRRHARRVETVLRPLFPRYLFVEIDTESEPWRSILSTFGVHSLIGDSDAPQPVPAAVIEALRARAGADGTFELKPRNLKSGDRVRVTVGPLADLEGLFEAETDADRVRVLLTLMGREVRVILDGVDLERA